MKIENNNEFKTNAVGENYKIATTGKMFSILSQKLYSNPILAIIRELSCNAIDAHKTIGNTQAFNIHLPSDEDPTFYVEDFGIGMSLKELVGSTEAKNYLGDKYFEIFDDTPCNGVYTTYGESLKTDTNDLTGGFGLGSKTPFAITNVFTIKTIKDGYSSTLINYLDDQSIPKYTITSFEKTSEKSGTKVSFKVDSEDFGKFNHSLNECVPFFEIKPNITNYNSKNQYWWDNVFSDWEIINSNRDKTFCCSPHGREYLVCGSVAYPLEYQHVFYNIKNNISLKQDNPLQFLLKNKIFFIPIGELSISPSREEVVYDNKTVSYLTRLYYKLKEDFEKLIDKEFSFEEISQIFRHKADALTNDLATVFENSYTGSQYNDCLFINKAIEFFQRRENLNKIFINDSINLTIGNLISKATCKVFKIKKGFPQFSEELEQTRMFACETQEEYDSIAESDLNNKELIGKVNTIHNKHRLFYGNCLSIVPPSFLKEYEKELGFKPDIPLFKDIEPIEYEIEKPRRNPVKKSIIYETVSFLSIKGMLTYKISHIDKDNVDVKNSIFLFKKGQEPSSGIVYNINYDGEVYLKKQPSVEHAYLEQLSNLVHFLKKLKIVQNQTFVMVESLSKMYLENNNLDKILKTLREDEKYQQEVLPFKFWQNTTYNKVESMRKMYEELIKFSPLEDYKQKLEFINSMLDVYNKYNFTGKKFFNSYGSNKKDIKELLPIESKLINFVLSNFYYHYEQEEVIKEMAYYIKLKTA